jgi:TolA-binding protein
MSGDGPRPPRQLSLVLSAALFLTSSMTGPAQTTEIPVAAPATTNAAPPVAQPVNPAPSPTPAPATTNAAPLVTPPTSPVTNAAPPANPAPANTAPAAVTGGLVVLPLAQARFDNAMAAYNAGQYADAVTAFSSFVTDFPEDRRREEALYRLAESYRNLNRATDALAAYTYQVQSYPEGPLRINAELRRGAIMVDKGRLTASLTPLKLVADKGDGDLQQAAKYLMGRALLALKREPESRVVLQSLVDQQPPGKFTGGAAQMLAELDDSQNRFPEALVLWQKALAATTDPATQASIAARGGWSAIQANQIGDAEKLFQTARKIDVGDPDSRKVANTGLLRILFQQKRFTEWLAVYEAEENRLLDSARSETLYDLGHAQFALKHWSESATAFAQYLHEFGDQDAAVTADYERFLAVITLDKTRTEAEAAAYLKAWPQSPYRARVQLFQAQEMSREKKFAEVLPLWESLVNEPATADWPHQEILLELARTYDAMSNWPKASAAYQVYLDDLSVHPAPDKAAQLERTVRAEARLAVSLQNSGEAAAATDAWKAVRTQAQDGSPEQQIALESLGLIYARGGPTQEAAAVETFRALLQKFPKTKLRAMAAFSVADSLFKAHDYDGAEPYLLNARDSDASTWEQPATQRLVLGAYGKKDFSKTESYVKEYDTIAAPSDPQAQAAARLPAAVFYWLAENARKAGNGTDAETYYTRVTQHPDPGDLLAGAWWQLGEVQSGRKEWADAVKSYQMYRSLKPDAKNATVVLLALGRAELGAKDTDSSKKIGEQALLQEPEGPNSAAARTLLAETAFAAGNFPEAARMFATLAVLFDDPKIGPQAMARAADSFDQAGDAKSAADWRKKLTDKYPGYQPAPFL